MLGARGTPAALVVRDPRARRRIDDDDGDRGGPHAVARAGFLAAARRLLSILVWGVLPLAIVVEALAAGHGTHYAGDFHYAFWPAGQRILAGASPYVNPGAPEVARATAFVYPAVGALLLAPFAALPRELADAVFTALNIACVPLTLRVLGVRDWRLYGASLLCLPVLSGWLVGNVTLLLVLGVALLWRRRDHPLVAGLLAAIIVSSKLFLWPLGLWLLATRRYAAFGWMVVWGAAVNAVAWAILGFDEIGRYRRLLHALADRRDDLGYSVVSVALRAGAAHGASYALAAALTVVVAAACVLAGRRGREHGALALAVLTCLLATPIVQVHYFALLIVPLALARPRLAPAWLLPLAFWVCSGGRAWQAALALAIAAGAAAVCLKKPPEPLRLGPAAAP
jgi:hypothetical protein